MGFSFSSRWSSACGAYYEAVSRAKACRKFPRVAASNSRAVATGTNQYRRLYIAVRRLEGRSGFFLTGTGNPRDDTACPLLEFQIVGLHVHHHAVMDGAELDVSESGK